MIFQKAIKKLWVGIITKHSIVIFRATPMNPPSILPEIDACELMSGVDIRDRGEGDHDFVGTSQTACNICSRTADVLANKSLSLQ